jgi:hypothetical protein
LPDIACRQIDRWLIQPSTDENSFKSGDQSFSRQGGRDCIQLGVAHFGLFNADFSQATVSPVTAADAKEDLNLALAMHADKDFIVRYRKNGSRMLMNFQDSQRHGF